VASYKLSILESKNLWSYIKAILKADGHDIQRLTKNHCYSLFAEKIGRAPGSIKNQLNKRPKKPNFSEDFFNDVCNAFENCSNIPEPIINDFTKWKERLKKIFEEDAEFSKIKVITPLQISTIRSEDIAICEVLINNFFKEIVNRNYLLAWESLLPSERNGFCDWPSTLNFYAWFDTCEISNVKVFPEKTHYGEIEFDVKFDERRLFKELKLTQGGPITFGQVDSILKFIKEFKSELNKSEIQYLNHIPLAHLFRPDLYDYLLHCRDFRNSSHFNSFFYDWQNRYIVIKRSYSALCLEHVGEWKIKSLYENYIPAKYY
jgi:hypothetical protein